MTESIQHTVVYGPIKYGPVKKDRLGNALVVDPMPPEDPSAFTTTPTGKKLDDLPNPVSILCTSTRPPSAGVIVTSAARRIIEMSKAGEKLHSIVVMGHGDPTRHPNFKEIVENLRELRDKWFSKAAVTLFATPLFLDDPEIRHTVAMFDKPILRFEWGTAKTFASLTGERSTRLRQVVENLANTDRMILQATFRKGAEDNSAANEVKGWLKRVDELRPLEVHISTVEPTKKRGAPRPVPPKFLEGIAEQVREQTGVPAQVFELEPQVA